MNKEQIIQQIGVKAPVRELMHLIEIKDSKDKNLKIITDNCGGQHHVFLTNTTTGITLLLEAFPRLLDKKLEEIPAQLLNILDYHPETNKEIRLEIKKAGETL